MSFVKASALLREREAAHTGGGEAGRPPAKRVRAGVRAQHDRASCVSLDAFLVKRPVAASAVARALATPVRTRAPPAAGPHEAPVGEGAVHVISSDDELVETRASQGCSLGLHDGQGDGLFQVEVVIVGRHFHAEGNRLLSDAAAKNGAQFVTLLALREPDNPYDPMAVALHAAVGEARGPETVVGHLPRAAAARLAPAMDAGHLRVAGADVDTTAVLTTARGGRLPARLRLVALETVAGAAAAAALASICSEAGASAVRSSATSSSLSGPHCGAPQGRQRSLLRSWGPGAHTGAAGSRTAGPGAGACAWAHVLSTLIIGVSERLGVVPFSRLSNCSRELRSASAGVASSRRCRVALERWLCDGGLRELPRAASVLGHSGVEVFAEGADWRPLALAVLAAPGVRATLEVCCSAARRGVSLESLRELMCLLVLLLPGLELPFGGRRLFADTLVCSRLLEDAGPSLPPQGIRVPGVRLTQEQAAVVQCDLLQTDILTISAFAGAGKTMTLRIFALLRPHLSFLYLCFNVAVREEACRSFPSHVTCKNAHQLAYAAFGFKYAKKLTDALRAEDVVSLPIFQDSPEDKRLVLADAAVTALNSFLHSMDSAVSASHVPSLPGIQPEQVCDIARHLWDSMRDPKATSVHMTHDGYLKLYSLSKPALRYDVVLLDEAQDCSPAIAGIVACQRCARVLVGDSHQSIYGFLGATDALSAERLCPMGDTIRRRYLTQVFRFGPNIADVANFVLGRWKSERRPLLGRSETAGAVQLTPPMTEMLQRVAAGGEPFAFVARTNAEVLHFALAADSVGLQLSWVGGVKGYRLQLLRDLCLLALGQQAQAESRRVRAFKSVEALAAHAKRVGDAEMMVRIQLLHHYEQGTLLRRVDRMQAEASAREKGRTAQQVATLAQVHLATVHKAKGLEWNTVVVAGDFSCLQSEMSESGGHRADMQEVNALYVALTRARRVLFLPEALWQMYSSQADAPAVMPLSSAGGATGRCPACDGAVAREARRPGGPQGVLVGSFSGARLCRPCTRGLAFAAPLLAMEGD